MLYDTFDFIQVTQQIDVDHNDSLISCAHYTAALFAACSTVKCYVAAHTVDANMQLVLMALQCTCFCYGRP